MEKKLQRGVFPKPYLISVDCKSSALDYSGVFVKQKKIKPLNWLECRLCLCFI